MKNLLLIAIVAVFALAACGQDDSKKGAGTPPATDTKKK